MVRKRTVQRHSMLMLGSTFMHYMHMAPSKACARTAGPGALPLLLPAHPSARPPPGQRQLTVPQPHTSEHQVPARAAVSMHTLGKPPLKRFLARYSLQDVVPEAKFERLVTQSRAAFPAPPMAGQHSDAIVHTWR